MLNRDVEQAFCDYMQATITASPAAFAPTKPGRTFSFYTTEETGTFKLPCMSFELPEGTPLHAGTRVSQGVLTVWIETQADDETRAVHDVRADATLNILADVPTVVAAINAAGNVKIFGYALGKSSTELKARHWTTALDLTVGYGPLPPPA